MLHRTSICFVAAVVFVWALPAPADRFDEYTRCDSFALPGESEPLVGITVFDVHPVSGKLIAVVGADVYLETGVHTRSFEFLGPLPDADIPLCHYCGPSFVRVSPDGQRIAVGNNGGASFSDYKVGIFDLNTGFAGDWFLVNHFDAEWYDNDTLVITAGAFGAPSIVTALDTTSDPNNPTNPTVIDNIGGGSAGITFDASGNLYTGNGFAGAGPSGTGDVKYFDHASWTAALSGGPPVDFEAEGILIVDVLSALSLGFDAEGNLHVGGGDFGSGDSDYAALVSVLALQEAIAGLGPADPTNPGEVRQFDPETFSNFNFYDITVNPMTDQLYIREDSNVYVYASPFVTKVLSFDPAPGQWVNNPAFNDPVRSVGAPSGGGTSAPDNTSLVSLGGFGGSITLAFDHTVWDEPDNPMGLDAIVFGNAYWVSGNHNIHWAECAYLEISRDLNANGQADDPWYLVPGSHITDPAGQYETQTWDDDTSDPTYPPDNPSWIPPGQTGQWTTSAYRLPPAIFEVLPLVNPNGENATVEGIYGYAEYAPTLLLGDMDADDIVDDPDIPATAFYTVPDDAFIVGMTPGSGGGDAFDIAWAIDPATSQPANLDGFDFIRIINGLNYIHGAFGELSAEIDAVADVSPDCNGNLVADWYDIQSGTSLDVNGSGVPDECECRFYGDVNGDGEVNLNDLLCMLDGLAGIFECPDVAFGDLDIYPCEGGNGDVNLMDLLALLDSLAGQPPCPDDCP